MQATTVCPHCGQASLCVRQIEIREIDMDRPAWKPSRKMTESECKECGWTGMAPALSGEPDSCAPEP